MARENGIGGRGGVVENRVVQKYYDIGSELLEKAEVHQRTVVSALARDVFIPPGSKRLNNDSTF